MAAIVLLLLLLLLLSRGYKAKTTILMFLIIVQQLLKSYSKSNWPTASAAAAGSFSIHPKHYYLPISTGILVTLPLTPAPSLLEAHL